MQKHCIRDMNKFTLCDPSYCHFHNIEYNHDEFIHTDLILTLYKRLSSSYSSLSVSNTSCDSVSVDENICFSSVDENTSSSQSQLYSPKNMDVTTSPHGIQNVNTIKCPSSSLSTDPGVKQRPFVLLISNGEQIKRRATCHEKSNSIKVNSTIINNDTLKVFIIGHPNIHYKIS